MLKLTQITACAILGLTSWGGVPASAEDIGVVASLQPRMQATAPGQGRRTLSQGDGVVQNDVIQTGRDARGQLLFKDQTTLSVAPSSQVVLDRFVYDPTGGEGAFGLNMAQGALRFIGGKTSENQQAVITTPTASIGIRGSSALIWAREGRTVAVLMAGDKMCNNSLKPPVCTSRQGGVLTERGYAGRVAPEFLNDLLLQIDGAPPRSLRAGLGGSGIRDGNTFDRNSLSSRGKSKQQGLPEQQYLGDLGYGTLHDPGRYYFDQTCCGEFNQPPDAGNSD